MWLSQVFRTRISLIFYIWQDHIFINLFQNFGLGVNTTMMEEQNFTVVQWKIIEYG